MKYLNLVLLGSVFFSLTMTATDSRSDHPQLERSQLNRAQLNGTQPDNTSHTLARGYLQHWFSIDSAEQHHMQLDPIKKDLNDKTAYKQSRLRFTSDDGQSVNGKIAYPSTPTKTRKLALALHPMGTDQDFWWSPDSPLQANKLTDRLLQLGYIVISLDARRHGERAHEGFGPRELLQRAHSDEPRLYTDTIIGSVRDYRVALDWAKSKFEPQEILLMGYSMGAQMSLLLASYEPSVNTVLAMVPPYVNDSSSPVAPRNNVAQITTAEVLWLAGTEDPHSSEEKTTETFALIGSEQKNIVWFESAHRLPPQFIDTALNFFEEANKQ